MFFIKQVGHLLRKEFLLEWRQKYALSGVLLYMVSTVVLIFMAFQRIPEVTWLTLYWIILLFAAVNAVAKSFLQESKGRLLYYYSLCSPAAIIVSKMIYNVLLLLVIGFIGLFVYTIMLGNPVVNQGLFILTLILGCIGFSLCFTLVSAIAAQASRNATLMPILSFPIIIPMLSLLILASKASLIGEIPETLSKDISILVALDGILCVLSVILFPYLWRD